MTVSINGTSGIVNDATDLNYTGTLTGGTGVVNLGSGQVYKNASGNVGIGTSSPSAKLHVYASSGDINGQIETAGAGQAALNLYNSTRKFRLIADASANALVIYDQTASAERARIDSSGNLLVGTTSSDITAVGIRLMNNNQLQTSKSSDWSLRTGRRDSTGIIQEIYYNSSRVGDIATNGTGTSYNTASDYRLKEAIAPMTGALARVAALRPCTYKWKVDGSDGQGFIAHELAEVEAGCVTGEKDAVDAEGKPQYQGIDTSFLVATLTAAIQELKTLVDTQAARITALEAANV